MKTFKTICTMVIGMMMVSTTSFGKTLNHGPRPVSHPQQTVVIVKDNHCHHDRMTRHNVCCNHRHVLDRRHHNCRICRIPLDCYGRPLPTHVVRPSRHMHR